MNAEEHSSNRKLYQVEKYQFGAYLDADAVEIHQVDECIYYFHYCQGKRLRKDKDYEKGYFVVIYHCQTSKLSWFFKVSKKFTKLKVQARQLFDNPGVNCKKLKQKQKNLVIEYEQGVEILELQVKFEKDEVIKELKQLIQYYQPALKAYSKSSKGKGKNEEAKVEERLISTKDTKDSSYDEISIKSIQYSTSSRRTGEKCQCEQIESELRQSKLRIRELQELLNTERSTREVYLQQNQSLRRSSGSFESQRERELLEKICILEDKIRASDAKLQRFIMENNQDSPEQPSQQSTNQLKTVNEDLKSSNQQLRYTLSKLELMLNQSKQKQEQMIKQLQILRDQVKQLNDSIKKYQKDLQAACKTNEELVSSNDALNQCIMDLQAQANNHQQFIKKIQRYEQMHADDMLQLKQITQQKDDWQQLKIKYQAQLVELTIKYQKSLHQTQQSNRLIEQNTKLIKTITFNNIFNNNLMENFHSYKQFLVNQIEFYMNRTICRTKNLYQFDPLNKVNFHSYIDNCPNIVVVIRTSSGFLLAAFSQTAFYPKVNASDGGLILSLTSGKVFSCQEEKKAITYDEYYIIFGNSQVRIKSQENKVFSNFGIANGFYNNGGYKVDILFGENSREVSIDTYEIYQVYFE